MITTFAETGKLKNEIHERGVALGIARESAISPEQTQ